MSAVAPPPPNAPRPPGQRVALLFKLLILPVVVFSLPTLLVTHFFGQRPAPKTVPAADLAAFGTLRGSLEKAASTGLPDVTLDLGTRFDELTLPCPAEAAEARLETLRGLAARCQGNAIEQPADAAGRHLLVELPEVRLTLFRQLATENAPAMPPPPAAEPANGTKMVFLNVTLAPPAANNATTTAAVKTP